MSGWSPPVGSGAPRTRREGSGRDRGSVTAETALALPVLLAVLAVALWAVAAVSAQLRCADAAAGAARAAARGEPPDAVTALARRLAPEGADVQVGGDGDEVVVVVTARVAPPAVAAVLPGLEVEGRAVALREPGVGP
ncbi:MAG TPA: TadE family type IV pilus minor pilin [Mycobacteriales bacterium]|nr:TadE family type IV pilus minor pilin [Mycobacteriales bacterium]